MNTFVHERRQLVSQLLELVCHQVQLTKTQYNDAIQHYESVGAWLGASGSELEEFSPNIYPQGSMALETTVKPTGQVEFDLDAIVVVNHPDKLDINPNDLFKMTRDRLASHGTFGPLLDKHEKCIRLSYANNFHIDIVPAIPHIINGGTSILIPRRKNGNWIWLENDPKGYKAWFDQRTTAHLAVFAARSEPLPRQRSAHQKDCLRRSTQLLKRRRDVFFDGGDWSPSSIVLTTLSAEEFDGGEICAPTLGAILAGIKARIDAGDGKIRVCHPTNPKEVFTAGWADEEHEAFRDFIDDFIDKSEALFVANGLHKVGAMLAELFDTPENQLVRNAMAEYEGRTTENREAVNIGVDAAGAIVPATMATSIIRPNTFYGDEKAQR